MDRIFFWLMIEESIASGAEASSSNDSPERANGQEVPLKEEDQSPEEEEAMYDAGDWNDSDTVHGHSQPEPDDIQDDSEGAEGERASDKAAIEVVEERLADIESEAEGEKRRPGGKDTGVQDASIHVRSFSNCHFAVVTLLGGQAAR